MERNDYIVEYYKNTGKIPTLSGFRFEDAFQTAFKLPPERALEWLKQRGKNLKVSTNWDELDTAAHNKAFTVSKVMSADLLQDIYNHVDMAKSKGWTLKQFKENLLPKLQNSGWTGGTPSRLKVIYDTNMQMAYSQGKFKQQKLISDIYPFWKYSQIERSTKRHDHSLLNNKVFRHDDPIWKKIYPPSGFGCKCSVFPIKENSNLQEGSKYLDELQGSKDFQMTPLDAWEVDTSKYVDGIRKQLQKFLKTESTTKADLKDSILDQDYLKELDKAGFDSVGAEVLDHHMLAEKAGFTEKPNTMSSSEIENLSGDEYYTCYRGTGKIEYYDTFKNGDYFSGRGVFGSGTYTALNKAESYGYTDTGKIMKILFPKSARIVTFNKLLEEQLEFFKNELPKLAKKKKLNINQVKRHLSDIGAFAIFRNYDAIYMESHEYLIIQNRSICIAQDELEDVL